MARNKIIHWGVKTDTEENLRECIALISRRINNQQGTTGIQHENFIRQHQLNNNKEKIALIRRFDFEETKILIKRNFMESGNLKIIKFFI